ncbi:hypothetical protein CRUP_007248 [Coryphaenoides rupestris]|nr:hypothetical protein CRUP_007248 [Coryphaenoides rupestris]
MDFDIDLDSLLDATEDGSQLKMARHATETHLVMASPTTTEVQNQSTVLFQPQPQTELKSGLVPQPSILPEGLSAKLEGTVGALKVDPLEKLKDAIDKVMPEQIARFHDNRQAHAQVKSTKVTEEKTREQRVNVGSDDEGEEKIGRRGPQKKFKWNQEISGCCPEEMALFLDTDKKTLKEVLTANAHPHVLVCANSLKPLDRRLLNLQGK